MRVGKLVRLNNAKISIIFLLVGFIEMYCVMKLTDLPPTLDNWQKKATLLLHFHAPEDNFYPPGSALLLIPFLWATPKFIVANYFYWLLGILGVVALSDKIKNLKLRVIIILFIVLDPYLVWLCYSSQDTVFEFCILLWSTYFLIHRKYIIYIFTFYLLCLIRPSYWLTFLFIGAFLFIYQNKSRKLSNKIWLIPFIFLFATLGINKYIFNSYEIASESGITAYFSHNKYFYLSLPKFDMDVFLSKGGHMEIPTNNGKTDYQNAAIESIKQNPKEIVLGSLTKIDSYIFSSQKVPNLPGEYYLSADGKSIQIGPERLQWSLVIGNFIYAIHRGLMFTMLLLTIGAIVISRLRNSRIIRFEEFVLISPWIIGFIPGLVFYTETRFKIVSEILLVILIGTLIDELSKKTANK